MKPKFLTGTKVRIRARDKNSRLLHPDIDQYEDVIGTVLSSRSVVAFTVEPALKNVYAGTNIITTVYMYSIKVDNGTTLQDLMEDYLEVF